MKSSTKESIPAAILKQCVDVYLPFLTEAINHATTENFFSRPIKKVRTSKELQFHYLKKRILYRRRIIGP